MNLGQMQDELSYIVRDSKLNSYLKDWINNAILEIAADLELAPLKLVDPVELEVDTTGWLWQMPDEFHKKLFRLKAVGADGIRHHVHICSHADELSGRDHTETADLVAEGTVVVQGLNHYLGIYPLADNLMELWFYRKPNILTNADDVCDCLPPGFERRLVFPKTILLNYHFIADQVVDFPVIQGPFQYWEGKVVQGENELKNYFAKLYNKPRRHGGRDAIGPGRRWFRGYY